MLFPPASTTKAVREVLGGLKSGKDPIELVERALRIDPEFAPACFLAAGIYLGRGEHDKAEEMGWRALRLRPCNPSSYLGLGSVATCRGDHALAWRLSLLALRCCAGSIEVPAEVADGFAKLPPPPTAAPLDFSDPDLYDTLANAWQESRPEGVPAETPAPLVPFELLTDLRRLARKEVGDELLAAIRRQAAECAPVFHAALREWAREEDALDDQSLALLAAMLGEIGEPPAAPDLLELCATANEHLFPHVNWAAWRMGQRFPAETLAAIRSGARDASTPLRCAFAEHLGHLPDSVDAAPALLGLLDGFAKMAQKEDSAYLLLSVSSMLTARGHQDAARDALKRHIPMLHRKGRKLIEAEMAAEEPFISRLEQDGIPEFDIEKICLERALLDHQDDEDDDEDEDAPPLVKPGRNEPCWCGSGKKYKKCHWLEDEKESTPEVPFYQRLLIEVADGASKWHSRADMERAARLYWGSNLPKEADASASFEFFEWLVRDFRGEGGETAAEQYLRRHAARLTAEERTVLEGWRDGRYSLWEVQRVEEGVGVEVKEWFSNDRFFVNDVSTSKSLVRWDCTLIRVEPDAGRWVFSGQGMVVPRTYLDRFLTLIDDGSKAAGQPPAEWVRANSHRLHRDLNEMAEESAGGPQLANTDGDPLEFSAALYDVADEPALLAALRAIEGFTEEKDREFAWVGQAGMGPSTSLGRVVVGDGRLRLECNSRKRLVRGKKLIEDAAGKSVRYRKDEFESPASAMRRFKSAPPPKDDAPAIPLEVQQEIIGKHLEQHYATWPDTPLPALGGVTPREAVRSERGREQVLRLLRTFENAAERARQAGRPDYDFSKLRDALGLPRD